MSYKRLSTFAKSLDTGSSLLITRLLTVPSSGGGTRPDRSTMWSYLNPFPQLPKYRGPYNVGSTEYEIPVEEIHSSSPTPDKAITTIKFRVFYPTEASAKSKQSIPWLPTPQKEWNKAYASFLGLSDRSTNIMSNLPSLLSFPTLPAVQNAPLLSEQGVGTFPVVVFSHGLGGNYNTYSSFVGSLASCGAVCFVPEHRDGSAPISLIKTSKSKIERSIPYQKHSHNPNVEVLNARNAMLRIRMWELDQLYAAIDGLNGGHTFSNFADTITEKSPAPSFKDALNLKAGRVTWSGHSFGACTIVQFVKSVYYRQFAPATAALVNDKDGWDYTPLYTTVENGSLANQISSDSPVALLDLWTMPLRAKTTEWLWQRPMPCYDGKPSGASRRSNPSVLAIMSNEFYKYTDLFQRTKAILSPDPVEALEALGKQGQPNSTADTSGGSKNISQDQGPEPELRLDSDQALLQPTPNSAVDDTSSRSPSPPTSQTPSQTTQTSPASSVNSLHQNEPTTSLTPGANEPHLYYIPSSAHLSQSDFGLLFPNLTSYFLKAIEPEKTMQLNVRAVLAMMRGTGADLQNVELIGHKKHSSKPMTKSDNILTRDEERWKRVDLKTA